MQYVFFHGRFDHLAFQYLEVLYVRQISFNFDNQKTRQQISEKNLQSCRFEVQSIGRLVFSLDCLTSTWSLLGVASWCGWICCGQGWPGNRVVIWTYLRKVKFSDMEKLNLKSENFEGIKFQAVSNREMFI